MKLAPQSFAPKSRSRKLDMSGFCASYFWTCKVRSLPEGKSPDLSTRASCFRGILPRGCAVHAEAHIVVVTLCTRLTVFFVVVILFSRVLWPWRFSSVPCVSVHPWRGRGALPACADLFAWLLGQLWPRLHTRGPGWEPRDAFFSALGTARGLSLRNDNDNDSSNDNNNNYDNTNNDNDNYNIYKTY